MKFGYAVSTIAIYSMVGCSPQNQNTTLAEEALLIANKYHCMGCHSIDKKIVGPSFTSISAKYRGKDAQYRLASKVITGSAGVWGEIPMPAINNIPDNDLKKVILWITNLDYSNQIPIVNTNSDDQKLLVKYAATEYASKHCGCENFTVEKIIGDYAKLSARVIVENGNIGDIVTIYMKKENGTWSGLDIGTGVDPSELKIPQEAW